MEEHMERDKEKQKRVRELETVIDARIKEYPHTWHGHTDLQPIMREYYTLTRNNVYDIVRQRKTAEDEKSGR